MQVLASSLWIRITAVVVVLVLLLSAAATARELGAASVDGIGQGNNYQEVLYITGKPVVVTGTLDFRPGRPRGDRVEDRFTFRLENRTEEVRLTRTMTLTTTWRQEGTQQVRQTEVSRFRETITAGGERYQAGDKGCSLSYSLVLDNHPAVTYFSGNWYQRKVYERNRGEGQVIVTSSGETIGYSSPWGESESQRVSITVEGREASDPEQNGENWLGTAKEARSFSRRQEMTYVENEPVAISFPGGYLLTRKGDDYLTFEYDLPARGNREETGRRSRGRGELYTSMVPSQERLPVSGFQDIRGHWAQAAIERVVGLGFLESGGQFFAPGLPMNRGEFARALVMAAGLEPALGEGPVFFDVPLDHRYAPYINELARRQIVQGVRYNRFEPTGTVSRAQAAVMLIKLLGLEHMAPVVSYSQPYLDSDEIPVWARDSLYMAAGLGIIDADTYGRIRPHAVISRAEAAVFLDRFVAYLRDQMSREYGERLSSFR